MVPSLCEILNLILPERDVMSLTNLSLCQDMIKNLLSSPNIEKIIDESLQLQIHQMMESRLQFKEELLQKYNSTQLLQPATAEPPTILNRMEMDRDRHKRSKEQNWKVQRQTTATNATETLSVLNSFEFQQMWDNVGPLEPADLHNVDVLNGIARESYLL